MEDDDDGGGGVVEVKPEDPLTGTISLTVHFFVSLSLTGVQGIEVFQGTVTGLLKLVQLDNSSQSVVHGQPSRTAGVVSLEWEDGNGDTGIVVGLRDPGAVIVLHGVQGSGPAVAGLSVTGFDGPLAAAGLVQGEDDEGRQLDLACVTEAGMVHLVKGGTQGMINVRLGASTHSLLAVGGPVEAVAVANDCRRVFALGGKNNRLSLWDAVLRKRLYQARNPPDDWLGMSVPTWVSGIAFAQTKKTRLTEDGGVSATLAIITRFHELQLYETSDVSRRASRVLALGEDPLTCVAWTRQDDRIVVGNSIGVIWIINTAQWVAEGRLAPSCLGSVRHVACTTGPSGAEYVLAGGLDRFLYCYDVCKRQVMKKIYTKQKISKILTRGTHNHHQILEMVPVKLEDQGDEEDDVNDVDWGTIPVVDEGKKKRIGVESISSGNSSAHKAISKLMSKKKRAKQ